MFDIAYLRERLTYCPISGKLWWKSHYRRTGKEAFTATKMQGYKHGQLDKQYLLAHRVAWALYYGEWPDGEIDHINHVRDDNRLENLRLVSHKDNNRNVSIKATNTSGVTGVHWTDREQRWIAEIKVDGVKIGLGYFKDFDAAVLRRKAAEFLYGFHDNHGGI